MEVSLKYSNGQEVRIGDKVAMGDDVGGVVVCDIGAGKFSPKYLADEWSYLKVGILIEFPKYGVVHIQGLDPDLKLIARG